MVTVDDILGDDRSFVQALCHVMGCCANEFYSALEGSLIRFCANEGGEEAVVDIDNTVGVCMDDKRLENLHVTSTDEEMNFATDEVEYVLLIVFAMFFACRKVVIRDAIHLSQWFQVAVVANDKGDLHCQFAAFPAPKQICEAVVEPGD